MQDKNLGGFMPLIHVLGYLYKPLVDCGSNDAVVVVNETLAMAAKIAMSALSPIRQNDLSSAAGGAMQHAIIMQYLLDTDQMLHGVTATHLDTQVQWLLRGIPIWVWDSDRIHERHEKVQKPPKIRKCLRPLSLQMSLLHLLCRS